MRINAIGNYYKQNQINCQPIKKNTPSFGMKMSKEGKEYMSAIGAKIIEPIDESYINEPDVMLTMLKDIVAANGRHTNERIKKFADLVEFYGTSNTLPQSLKTKFIKEQILGPFGQKLQEMNELSNKLRENDQEVFRRAMVDLYIKGASYNEDIDVRDTMIFFNKVKDNMNFKESTYSNYALKTSIETMF